MLSIKKFSATQDAYVVKDFSNYIKGDIIPAGTLEKGKAISLWLEGKIQNVGVRIYTKHQLEKLPLKELKKIADPLQITGKAKPKLIEEILLAL